LADRVEHWSNWVARPESSKGVPGDILPSPRPSKTQGVPPRFESMPGKTVSRSTTSV
jgi:hypothetical protein